MVVNIYLQNDESMMIINSVKMFLLFFVVVVVVYLFVFLLFCLFFCCFVCFVLFFQVNALQDARFSARGKI